MDLSSLKTPLESIVRHDHMATAFNAKRILRERKFIVELACGHTVYTNAIDRCRCPRCCEMLRRSVLDGSEDYESYRSGLVRDNMTWHDDPCRQFNEKTDLGGVFVND